MTYLITDYSGDPVTLDDNLGLRPRACAVSGLRPCARAIFGSAPPIIQLALSIATSIFVVTVDFVHYFLTAARRLVVCARERFTAACALSAACVARAKTRIAFGSGVYCVFTILLTVTLAVAVSGPTPVPVPAEPLPDMISINGACHFALTSSSASAQPPGRPPGAPGRQPDGWFTAVLTGGAAPDPAAEAPAEAAIQEDEATAEATTQGAEATAEAAAHKANQPAEASAPTEAEAPVTAAPAKAPAAAATRKLWWNLFRICNISAVAVATVEQGIASVKCDDSARTAGALLAGARDACAALDYDRTRPAAASAVAERSASASAASAIAVGRTVEQGIASDKTFVFERDAAPRTAGAPRASARDACAALNCDRTCPAAASAVAERSASASAASAIAVGRTVEQGIASVKTFVFVRDASPRTAGALLASARDACANLDSERTCSAASAGAELSASASATSAVAVGSTVEDSSLAFVFERDASPRTAGAHLASARDACANLDSERTCSAASAGAELSASASATSAVAVGSTVEDSSKKSLKKNSLCDGVSFTFDATVVAYFIRICNGGIKGYPASGPVTVSLETVPVDPLPSDCEGFPEVVIGAIDRDMSRPAALMHQGNGPISSRPELSRAALISADALMQLDACLN
ncbi:hypothetical protein EMIHUDRAFT_222037 [Emiliania huxleyi CCMP1516]|uniref:Uncharacterized protein n=2 Tax=Emiliania huxleyi TaxID=2903 RepID=A0A0D3KZ20_EMIH1|nr:hypothetical protein EMIHUDRAFT_222037 [Emiliania huxleyi CCMP1516]EOD41005.1 hypothetical protein EMIHUDRAFT_222037 [Emiliania huxleyi CCMP1516]|eukprot:XP_005793434.1 hypothetical protein EMIHUDRAFT_222037 [Emiliania huxleyi CCMP1516]